MKTTTRSQGTIYSLDQSKKKKKKGVLSQKKEAYRAVVMPKLA